MSRDGTSIGTLGAMKRPAACVALAVVLTASPVRATVYWGDVHAHSGVSDDGSGTVENFFTVARDVVGLDFVTLSDHDVFTTPVEWEVSKAVAASFDAPGQFLAFSAVEWTHEWHMNAYFLGYDEPYCANPVCGPPEGFFDVFGPRVRAGEAAAHVNHPADVYKVQWDRIDDSIATNVEVFNVGAGGDQELGFGNALWALQAGLRLGLVGVSDDHHLDERPLLMGGGLTGCDVPALTHDEILRALRERRCYSTDGDRIGLDFDVGGAPMGGEFRAPLRSTAIVTVAVMGTDTPEVIELVQGGTVVAAKNDCSGPGCTFSMPVEIVEERTFLYARIRQRNGKRAWSSPIWVRGECTGRADCPPARLAPGGGPAASDCLAVWKVAPRVDRGGRGRPRLTCRDGDPRCDVGTTANECTLRVGLCLGVQDRRLRRCVPAAVDRYDLVQPGEATGQPSRDDLDFQNRRTLLAAIRALGAPLVPGVCTPLLALRVPLDSSGGPGGTGLRELEGIARAGATADTDRLTLRCKPARRTTPAVAH